jgi:iron complex outermembrane receptor protein
VVAVDGRNLRQRFNLSGSTSYGADVEIDVELSPRLRASLYGTALRARAASGDSAFPRLPLRPSYELGGALTWRPDEHLSLRAELRRVGPAVDLGPDGERSELPAGNELNLRGRYRLLEGGGGHRLSLTASIDNVTDELITPQLGLPLPGRSFRIGLQLD